MSRPIHQSSTQTRGFTIVEILVTVGILILIAAGVSIVFSSIAQTVNTGKRVAELNRFNAQLERIMRRDFENITRDGFMVIVHQETNDGTGNIIDTQLSPADKSDENNNGQPGRPRRIDEIMFFSRAQYETARRAISSGMIASSSEAAIYYGHGQRRRPDLFRNPNNDNNLFFNPAIDDFNPASDDNDNYYAVNQSGLGILSSDGGHLNPNHYAADWSLLRQVTLLAQPQTSGQDLPDELFGVTRLNNDRQWLEDSDRQVALQPALRTIFGSLNLTLPSTPAMPKWFKEYRSGGFVSFDDSEVYRSSGLVDIVTTDIPTIATIIRYGPGVGGWLETPLLYADFDAFNTQLETTIPPAPIFDPTQSIDPTSPIAQQRLWMLDTLPSRWDLSSGGPMSPFTQIARVRYESVPTRLLYAEDAFANDRDRIYAEADQEMLGSSVFVPKCTEFIVEWSMGYIDRTIINPTDPDYKRMLWYGLPRGLDENDNGTLEPTELHYADRYFTRNNTGLTPEQIATEKWISELVFGHNSALQLDTEISMFGFEYTNPEAAFSQNPIQPWPWPKFIRITVSIADANDINLEQTFQMVFEIPDASKN